MNLDFDHPNGNPDNSLLSGIPLIRVEFKCRRDLNEKPEQKARELKGIIDRKYSDKQIILIITHRSGFEGQYKPWDEFVTSDWERLSDDWITVLEPVFKIFCIDPKYIIQIGNEPDGERTDSSVSIPPQAYGDLFRRSYALIKFINPNTKVITAGFKSGAWAAYDYFIVANIKKYDGFAVHLYGAGAKNNPNFKLANGTNHLENHLNYLIARGINNIWITEFGILDNPNASPLLATQYIKDFMIASLSYNQIKAICYYGWGINMHNGWGLGTNTMTLHLNAKKALEYGSQVVIDEPKFPFVATKINVQRNIRSTPKVPNLEEEEDNKLILFSNPNEIIYINEKSAEEVQNYIWKEVITINGIRGWMAFDNTMSRKLSR